MSQTETMRYKLMPAHQKMIADLFLVLSWKQKQRGKHENFLYYQWGRPVKKLENRILRLVLQNTYVFFSFLELNAMVFCEIHDFQDLTCNLPKGSITSLITSWR